MRQKMLLLGAVFFGVIAFVLTYQQLYRDVIQAVGREEKAAMIGG